MAMSPMAIHFWCGDYVYGIWCPFCLLPSGYAAHSFMVSWLGVKSLGLTPGRCYDCGAIIPREQEARRD